MDSKKSFFIAGISLFILGFLVYLAIAVLPAGSLATPGWEPMFPSAVWSLGAIILAVTPFKKVSDNYVFNDAMSIISFVIAGLLVLLYIYNGFVF